MLETKEGNTYASLYCHMLALRVIIHNCSYFDNWQSKLPQWTVPFRILAQGRLRVSPVLLPLCHNFLSESQLSRYFIHIQGPLTIEDVVHKSSDFNVMMIGLTDEFGLSMSVFQAQVSSFRSADYIYVVICKFQVKALVYVVDVIEWYSVRTNSDRDRMPWAIDCKVEIGCLRSLCLIL